MAVRALPWQFPGIPQRCPVRKREIQPANGVKASFVLAHWQQGVRGHWFGRRHAPGMGCRVRKATFSVRTGRVVARLFDPEDFDPAKLTVSFESGSSSFDDLRTNQLLPRTYTLTHSDVTGHLQLSIGPCYNQSQLDSWYTRLMRDEIVAEWRSMKGQFSLHVHCHVSGEHPLLAPAALRNRIFQREMPLVLEAIRYGDGVLLARHPALDSSTVWVHFHSDQEEYDRADCWGPLFYAAISDGLKYASAQPSVPPLFDNGSFGNDGDKCWDHRGGSRLFESGASKSLRFLRSATVTSEAATIILTVSTMFLLQALTVT